MKRPEEIFMSNESLKTQFLHEIENFLDLVSREKIAGRSLVLDPETKKYYDTMDAKTKRAVKKELSRYGWRLHNQEDVWLHLVPNNQSAEED
jgi:hypothetical protein